MHLFKTLTPYLAILLFMISQSSYAAKDQDPCDQLIELSSSKNESKKLLQAIKNLVIPSRSIDNPTNADHPLKFTSTSGFALLPKCEGKFRYERSLYYPIGLTGLEVNKKHITDNGKKRQYSHIITEYGLHVYIPSDNLQSMEDGHVYVFANTSVPVGYCAGSPCKNVNGRELHPQLRYGVVDKDGTLSKIRNDARQRVCSNYDFTPMNSNGTDTQEHHAKINTCATENSAKLSRRLKITWIDKAKQDFTHTVRGTFSRLSPKHVKDSLNLLSLSYVKECGTEIERTEVLTLSSAVKTPKLFLSASADVKKGLKYTNTVPRDYYRRFAAYSWMLHNSDNYEIGDIDFVSKCSDLEPSKPLTIKLLSDKFPDHHELVLGVDALTQLYVDKEEVSGLSSVRDPNDLKQGKFWKINGYIQYFKWRATINHALNKSDRMTQLVRPMSEEEQDSMKNFIAHLILASAFSYGDEIPDPLY